VNEHPTFEIPGPSSPEGVASKSAEDRFSDASAKMKESINKHLNNQNENYSSSDEEDDDDHHGTKILDSMVKSFPGSEGK
jgi:hypothetical protein